jgi:hypothetical protein
MEEDVSSYWMTLKKGKERILEIERGSSSSHPAENFLWRRLWSCHQTDNGMGE